MNATALEHLAASDAVMRRLIGDIGPCDLRPPRRWSPFHALVHAVAHQQLNGTAAASILGRFRALFPDRRFPAPADLSGVSDGALRGAGFSRAKIAALRDLACKCLEGLVPAPREMAAWTDEDIITRLTAVKGVGRWTAQMLLMFQMGRPDVLPADDFGVRNGFRIAYRRRQMPTPRQLLSRGEVWRPHRTTAAWYLWRAADRAKDKVM